MKALDISKYVNVNSTYEDTRHKVHEVVSRSRRFADSGAANATPKIGRCPSPTVQPSDALFVGYEVMMVVTCCDILPWLRMILIWGFLRRSAWGVGWCWVTLFSWRILFWSPLRYWFLLGPQMVLNHSTSFRFILMFLIRILWIASGQNPASKRVSSCCWCASNPKHPPQALT